VRETVLAPSQLVLPLFVRPGTGCACRSDRWRGVPDFGRRDGARRDRGDEAGVGGVLLFGIPEHKDETGSSAWDDEGPVQRAVRALKREVRSSS
jgi:porphobilinogen synthase